MSSIFVLLTVVLGIFAIVFVYAGIPLIYGRCARVLLRHRAIRLGYLLLTFDDGPGRRLTPAILQLLAEYKVKATFFLLGRNIDGRESIVRRIAAEGHEICSHGYDHLNYWNVSPFRALRDIKRGWQSIDDALNEKRKKYPFRPPYGKLNIICWIYLIVRKVPIIYWSIVSGDTWPSSKIDSQRAGLLTEKAGGGIILFHDFDRSDDSVDGQVLASISSVLELSKNAGMRVATISELLNVHGQN